MAGMGMGPPYYYVCNYCNKEYHQTSNPGVCKVCGRRDFRVVTGKYRQGPGFGKTIILKQHTEKQ